MFLLVLAHPGSPRQQAIEWLCVCAAVKMPAGNCDTESAIPAAAHSKQLLM